MKKPWQVWFAYGLCLAVVVPAMVGLTLKTLELDRAEALANARADLEEEINLSLWRMDSLMTPILAEEAARPFHAYLPATAAGSYRLDATPATTSPLLTATPDHALLYFQRGADGRWSSPQTPVGDAVDAAVAEGVPRQTIRQNGDLLASLQSQLGDVRLLDRLKDREHLSEANADVSWDDGYRFAAPQTTASADQPQNRQADQDGDETFESFRAAPQRSLEEQSLSRGRREFSNRLRATQNYSQKAATFGRASLPEQAVFERVREGVSQPLWVGSQLLLARRVIINDETLVQGCWLDWPKIKEKLLGEVRNIPQADLVPVWDTEQPNPARMLATLPVRLVVDEQLTAVASWSPIKFSLLLAWICLLVAALAVAATLFSVMRLSERRAAFVSAVTHELRTPLTTFRMYSEMLAEDMVPNAEDRREYLRTMRTEADRLRHLVENVLSYARLERGRRNGSYEQVTVASLLDRVESRLSDRARQATMQLTVDVPGKVSEVKLQTSVTAVEQILFNLVDNACKYAVGSDNRRIEISVDSVPAQVRLHVRDHGPGIPRNRLRRPIRPFSKSAEEAADTAPGIGLGLGLCERLARDLGGKLQISDAGDRGAEVTLCLPISNQPSAR